MPSARVGSCIARGVVAGSGLAGDAAGAAGQRGQCAGTLAPVTSQILQRKVAYWEPAQELAAGGQLDGAVSRQDTSSQRRLRPVR
jgi:hypothetical protein